MQTRLFNFSMSSIAVLMFFTCFAWLESLFLSNALQVKKLNCKNSYTEQFVCIVKLNILCIYTHFICIDTDLIITALLKLLLLSTPYAGMYSEPWQTFKMELYAKIVND